MVNQMHRFFCDIENIENIAGDYVAERKKIENDYWYGMKEYDVVYRTKLANSYIPFFIPDYENGETDISKLTIERRIAQKAIYNLKLLETPVEIVKNENGNLLIWSYKGNYFISCNYDTQPIGHFNRIIEYDNVIPARGPGAKRIRIDDFIIRDSYQSTEIERLIVVLEKITSKKFKKYEYYDE